MQRRQKNNDKIHQLRVRTGRHYPISFVVDLGQRDAVFIKRPLTPLRRFFAWADAFTLLPGTSYDLIHTFNAVPLLTNKPYVITFEDFLPRVPEDRYIGWLEATLQRRLLSPQCIAIVAMSEYARRQFCWQNRNFKGLQELEKKMEVIYPAVVLRRSAPKRMSDKLQLVFVGADFMRKGGPALLRAHEQLRKQGVPVETTIVSSLQWSEQDYVGPPNADYVRQELSRLKQPGVTHYHGLPNAETLRLIEEADFYVAPTLHDTFGYASVEALSCGTPVIASHTCAQPEIVAEGQCGFLLPFENEKNIGKWGWLYRQHEPDYLEAYDRAIRSLSESITQRLMMCWENRGAYEAMSAAALDRVRERFHRDVAQVRLAQLYQLCRRC